MFMKFTNLFWTSIGDAYPVAFNNFLKWYADTFNKPYYADEKGDYEQFGLVWRWACEKCEYEWILTNSTGWWDDAEVYVNELFEQEEPDHESEDD